MSNKQLVHIQLKTLIKDLKQTTSVKNSVLASYLAKGELIFSKYFNDRYNMVVPDVDVMTGADLIMGIKNMSKRPRMIDFKHPEKVTKHCKGIIKEIHKNNAYTCNMNKIIFGKHCFHLASKDDVITKLRYLDGQIGMIEN